MTTQRNADTWSFEATPEQPGICLKPSRQHLHYPQNFPCMHLRCTLYPDTAYSFYRTIVSSSLLTVGDCSQLCYLRKRYVQVHNWSVQLAIRGCMHYDMMMSRQILEQVIWWWAGRYWSRSQQGNHSIQDVSIRRSSSVVLEHLRIKTSCI